MKVLLKNFLFNSLQNKLSVESIQTNVDQNPYECLEEKRALFAAYNYLYSCLKHSSSP